MCAPHSEWYKESKSKSFKSHYFIPFSLEFPICDQKIQYFAGYDRYEVALSYFKLKIPNIPNSMLFWGEIYDYGQTTYSHQYSLL